MLDYLPGGESSGAGTKQTDLSKLIPFLTCFTVSAFLIACGMSHQHSVDGKVSVEVKVSSAEFRVKIESVCDSEIDGQPVYATREAYRSCVSQIIDTIDDK